MMEFGCFALILVFPWQMIICQFREADIDRGRHEAEFFSGEDSATKNCAHLVNWSARPFEPLRLKFFQANMNELDENSTNVVLELINDLVQFETHLLRVRRVLGNISLPDAGACFQAGSSYPEHVRFVSKENKCDLNYTEGVPDADYVLYLFAYSRHHCGENVLGWADSCAVYHDGRPIIGVMNLCPKTIKTAKWNRIALFSLMRHEMFHALGFALKHYRLKTFIRNNENVPMMQQAVRRWKINPQRYRTEPVTVLVGPRVKAFAQKYFNCPSLEGAELEDDGDLGTRITHFEKRIFGPEVMTGYISRITYISNMTLGYLEDVGWFKTDYRYTQVFKYAEGAGCIFAKQSCREYIDSKEEKEGAAKPFCNWADYVKRKTYKSTARECSQDRDYYTSCDWSERGPDEHISGDEQYFLDKTAIIDDKFYEGSRVIGWTSSNDGCPVWIELLYGDDLKRTTRNGDSVCDNAYSQPPAPANWGAELYGLKSMCFAQDGKFEVFECLSVGLTKYHTETAHGAGCYEHKCENGRLHVRANYSLEPRRDMSYMRAFKVCWGEGTTVAIRRHQRSGPDYELRYHKGVIICPSCKSVCEDNTEWENGSFKCLPEYKINSTDYSATPCRRQLGTALLPGMMHTWVSLVLVFVSYLCSACPI